ncbi:hypothetical protein C0Q70_07968 [Pomacea canaliculata]|uniref:Bystin n=1 Tax=Pomacea canaliculata TaxID=400727 RepID=A0A2T7PGH3_POMCA|nr:hypothetical protein C0Q70_07968 [Pomacea canaliculata]
MPKIKKKSFGDRVERGVSLAEQIIHDKSVKQSGRTKQRNRRVGDDEYVDQKLSKKILAQARLQQEELEEEHGVSHSKKDAGSKKAHQKVSLGAKSDDSDSEEELCESEHSLDPLVIDEEDEKALEAFMSKTPKVQRTLADIIAEKLTEKQTEVRTHLSDDASVRLQDLDEKLVQCFQTVGEILSKYRSGKLPKIFKRLPNLDKWEQFLYITKPEKWTAAAVYQATRIFVSNLSTHLAQQFLNVVLLPRIRDDIAEYKKLNFHLYAVINGFCDWVIEDYIAHHIYNYLQAGDCTLREAIILSSLLSQNSVPMLHSAVAISKIAMMEYTGATSIFIRTLLDKKYALPYSTVDTLMAHFLRFMQDERKLPVLWHQCLLTFVQRYKCDLTAEQKEQLYQLLHKHEHHEISPEVRRELQHSVCRGEETPEQNSMQE